MEPSPKINKSKINCCVPLCTKVGYFLEDGIKISFHKFPEDKKMQSIWISKIRRDPGENFHISKSTKVCSRHFTKDDFRVSAAGKKFLKENAVPTVFEWSTCKTPRSSVYKHRLENNLKDNETTPVKVLSAIENELHVTPTHTATLSAPSAGQSQVKQLEVQVQELQKKLISAQDALKLCQKEKKYLCEQNSLLGKQVEEKQKLDLSLDSIKDSEDNIQFYTGFPTYKTLMQCLELLNPGENGKNIVYYDSKVADERKISRGRKLEVQDEFLLTLMRLRLGLFEKDLAHRFKISLTSVHRILVSWINFMYLRLGSLPIWPTKDAIRATMPESFKEKFPNAEWIIDAFELQTERPSSLSLASQSYSNYKSRNTLKGLIACTPSGQIGFISQLYTGSISDRELIIRSGFLKMDHTRGATWLVDKGFQIEDLVQPLGVTVNMPAFLGSNSQMSAEEVFTTQQIASERIHVERAINKVKNFHIFSKPIPLSMSGTVNQMWTVCALLTLFHNPIISA